jgi:hypothetical protein
VADSKPTGVVAEAVSQIGMFCCRQLSTFCPVSADSVLLVAKQLAPDPWPKIPSVVLHAANAAESTSEEVVPKPVQTAGRADRQVLHLGVCDSMQVRTLPPVKGVRMLLTKHTAAFPVPKAPSAAWHVVSAAVLTIEPRRLELPSEVHDEGSVCKHVPEAPPTEQILFC